MEKVRKALEKLTQKERKQVEEILIQLDEHRMDNLNIKKLKGRDDVFRIRKGKIRIIYRTDKNNIFVLAIERRSDTTYHIN